jgi:hypothetical protein
MTSRNEIPEDVIETARVLNMRLHKATELGQRTQWIAEAIIAERRRCEAALSAAESVGIRNDDVGFVDFLNADRPYMCRKTEGTCYLLIDRETQDVVGYRKYDDETIASPAPSVAVKAAMTNAEINQWIDACNHEPAKETLRHYLELRSAASAKVQDDSETVDCLLAGKPFVFDPATNFCHADDGGAPEHGIKYVPAAQVQDVAEVSPEDYMRRHDAAIAAYEANTPNDYRYSALALRKAVDAAFAVAAAPAKQETPGE